MVSKRTVLMVGVLLVGLALVALVLLLRGAPQKSDSMVPVGDPVDRNLVVARAQQGAEPDAANRERGAAPALRDASGAAGWAEGDAAARLALADPEPAEEPGEEPAPGAPLDLDSLPDVVRQTRQHEDPWLAGILDPLTRGMERDLAAAMPLSPDGYKQVMLEHRETAKQVLGKAKELAEAYDTDTSKEFLTMYADRLNAWKSLAYGHR